MPLDAKKFLTGDSVATAEFLDADYNPVIMQMDHGLRQRQFKESKANMQQQLTAVGQGLLKTFLSPLKTEREGSDALENVTDMIPGGALKAGAGAIGTLVGKEAAKTAFGRMADKLPTHIGPEGLARVEISDAAASFTKPIVDFIPNRAYRLEEVLKHDLLYDVYPNLKNQKIIIDSTLEPKLRGRVTGDGIIRLNPAYSDTSILTTLHEVQHKIQDFEGFARGGSSSEFVRIAADETQASQFYHNLYGEAEARAITNKFTVMQSLFEDLDKVRKSGKVPDIKEAMRRLKYIEQRPVTEFIADTAGSKDVPLLATTSRIALTDDEILGYMNVYDEWKATQKATPTTVLTPKTTTTSVKDLTEQLEELMAKKKATAKHTTAATTTKSLEKKLDQVIDAVQNKPKKLKVNRDANGLISTIDIGN